jgi:ABC-type proline/glycine betaine transport system permease subunit
MPSRIIATSLALVAFATAVVGGIWADNPALTTIARALVAMVVCYLVGSIIGSIAQRVIDENIQNYKQANPAQDDIASTPQATELSDSSTSDDSDVVIVQPVSGSRNAA